MQISPANIKYFFTQLETRYSAAYTTADTWAPQYAMVVPATTSQFLAGWMGMLDKFRQWRGSRVTRQPNPQTYAVTIFPYELTEQIDKFVLADDLHGIYFPTVQMMGMQAKKLSDYLLRDMIFDLNDQTGVVQNGFDGLTNWNTAHNVDFWDASKGTYCNDYRGGVSISGVPVGGSLTVNGYATVYEDMCGRKSESGEALGLLPTLTAVAPQNHANARTVMQSAIIGAPQIGTLGSGSGANAPFVGSTSNPLVSWTDLHVNPDFGTNALDWLMLVTNGPVKPFGIAMREEPTFAYRVSPTDPEVFNNHTFTYGAESRQSPMWGFSWLGSISGPTANA